MNPEMLVGVRKLSCFFSIALRMSTAKRISLYVCLVVLPRSPDWIYGDPVRAVLDRVVPARMPDLARALLYEACPRAALVDRLLNALAVVVVGVVGLAQRLAPRLPAFDVSICLRKRFVHDRTVEAIAAGARQVLVLGAGYDVLVALLAPRYPDVVFVEVDHPSTAVFKRAALQKIGRQAPNAHLVAVDLATESVDERLLDDCREWDRDAVSVVVAEGLFMYLTPEAVRQCLRAVKAVAAPGSRLVFSYVTKADMSRASILGSKPFQALLGWVGEPILWAPDFIRDVEDLLAGEGFDADLSPKQSDHYQLYLSALQPLPPDPYYRNKHGVAVVK